MTPALIVGDVELDSRSRRTANKRLWPCAGNRARPTCAARSVAVDYWERTQSKLRSAFTRTDLLVTEIYPDAADALDNVTYTYNRQGQRTSKTDQNGSVHAYSYDVLGRQTADSITTLAASVDSSVQNIAVSYEIHGLVYQITSYANSAGTEVVNQVQNEYNAFQQFATQYQEHGGAVNTSTTPSVQYGYADGSANTIRPTSLTYPNGRVLNTIYNSGDDDALSRVSGLGDSSYSPLVAYTYLGLGSFVQLTYPQPGVTWTLITGAGIDPYGGLDQFGRVINNLWENSSGAALDEIQYTYDQASNRTSRKNCLGSP